MANYVSYIVSVPRGLSFGGDYQITGTVKTSADPINVPVSRQVRLHDHVNGQCCLQTWADPDTGYFEFTHIADRKYYVVVHDYTLTYNGLIRTDVRPIRMPPIVVAPVPPSIPTDPFFSSVVSLFPLSSNLTDVKSAPWTNAGPVALSNTQAKWGSNSALFTGSGVAPYSHFVMADGSNSNLSNRDFAVECWFYPTTLSPSVQRIIACNDLSGNDELTVYMSNDGSAAFGWYHSGAQQFTTGVTAGTITVGSWHYLKASRIGDNHYFQINGVTNSITKTHTAPTNASRHWTLGTFWNNFARQPFYGYVQDFRLTLDHGRPGTTVPIAAFPTA